MTDERTSALLSAVRSLCEGGGFKIVDEEEIARLFSGGEGEIRAGMSLLAERRLVELVYAEEGTYCVRVLPAGREYADLERDRRRLERETRREVFFFALLGGALGGICSFLIALLVSLL